MAGKPAGTLLQRGFSSRLRTSATISDWKTAVGIPVIERSNIARICIDKFESIKAARSPAAEEGLTNEEPIAEVVLGYHIALSFKNP